MGQAIPINQLDMRSSTANSIIFSHPYPNAVQPNESQHRGKDAWPPAKYTYVGSTTPWDASVITMMRLQFE